jgi:hypothetical protein
MEAIVTVEFRFCHDFKYTSQYKGMEATIAPSFGVPMWYLGLKSREGAMTTIMDQCSEDDIVQALLKEGYSPLFMKWCMEESREHGFNPFVMDRRRLIGRPNLVYISHDMTDNLIKVGTTGNLKKRLRSLYGAKGHIYKTLALMQGSYNTEHTVHQRFKEHLVAGREWFRPHQEIYDFIEEYAFDPGEAVNL